MKILLTGAGGQLGSDCRIVLSYRHDVFTPGSAELDITDPFLVEKAFGIIRPDIVLNCAAFTRVDDCETERASAWSVNAEGPGILAEKCFRFGSKLIHVSTDYVFDGLRPPPEPYSEDDPPAPVSYYGESKLAGEEAIRNAGCEYSIVRTSWLYGRTGRNFPKTILKAALRRPDTPLKIVDDKHGSPTWSYRLARQIEKLIETEATGLYHATAEGHCTWYRFASHFLERMGVECRVIPCTSEEYPTKAKRPANSILENKRLKAEGINIMDAWERDVDEFVLRHGQELIEEARKEG